MQLFGSDLISCILYVIVIVHAQDQTRPFSDVYVSIDSDTSGCEPGQFHVNRTVQYQPRNCRTIVASNTKSPALRMVFRWTAPSCGSCVHVR
jgi:hypothetical protein